jgi:hypothetical protein
VGGGEFQFPLGIAASTGKSLIRPIQKNDFVNPIKCPASWSRLVYSDDPLRIAVEDALD